LAVFKVKKNFQCRTAVRTLL